MNLDEVIKAAFPSRKTNIKEKAKVKLNIKPTNLSAADKTSETANKKKNAAEKKPVNQWLAKEEEASYQSPVLSTDSGTTAKTILTRDHKNESQENSWSNKNSNNAVQNGKENIEEPRSKEYNNDNRVYQNSGNRNSYKKNYDRNYNNEYYGNGYRNGNNRNNRYSDYGDQENLKNTNTKYQVVYCPKAK